MTGADRKRSWFDIRSWLRWRPTSAAILAETENKILQHIQAPLDKQFTPISGGQKQIWTVIANRQKSSTPLVMVHGFGGGTGLWAQNIDKISQKSPVYMFDLLGFGQSTRFPFSNDAATAEKQFVDSLEEWREKMKLDKFILLGHSLGGFIVSSYALRYPEKVKHLILVDPWGYPEKPPNSGKTLPLHVKVFIALAKPFNPLAILRAAGPCGPGLVKRFRSDLGRRYSSFVSEDLILDYVYHVNAQYPSGEQAFKYMTQHLGWAKNPMICRVADITPDLPITMIFGSRSWVSSNSGFEVRERRLGSYVDVQVVKGAGHHVYADKPENFNAIVSSICEAVEQDRLPIHLNIDTEHKEHEEQTNKPSDPLVIPNGEPVITSLNSGIVTVTDTNITHSNSEITSQSGIPSLSGIASESVITSGSHLNSDTYTNAVIHRVDDVNLDVTREKGNNLDVTTEQCNTGLVSTDTGITTPLIQ